MKVNYYSIKDNVSGHFGPLVTSENDVAVLRDLRYVISDKTTKFNKFPEDFDLWHMGDLDDESGIFTSDPYFITSLMGIKPFEEASKDEV